MTTKKKQKEKKVDDIEMDDIVFEEEEVSSMSSGAGQVKKLRERLKKCTEEKQEYLDGWQRSKADFVNLKKEHEEMVKNLKKFASEDLINDLLPVIESFNMAFANEEVWKSVDENWRKGVEYIHTQLMNVLESKGLKNISPLGEKFDHNKHESVEMLKTENKDEVDKVAEVVREGYELNGKVLKPAKVKVYN